MAHHIHVGMELRHKSEPSWPTIVIHSIHENPDASFAGNPLKPYAFIEWQDTPGVHTAHSLKDLQDNWEDTGV